MSKKLTFGKLAGIIFCIIAAAAAVVLMFASGYYGGQMKLIDKCFTAIERDDYNSFKTCFSEEDRESITEEYFSASKGILSCFADNEDNKAAVSFVSRERTDRNAYTVTFDLTVYNDGDHTTFENTSICLLRKKGKWTLVL